VEAAEAGVAFLAHVAFEDLRVGLAQIDYRQAIDHIGKFAVEIEAYQPASHLGILLEQDGQSLAIFFDVTAIGNLGIADSWPALVAPS